MDSDSGDDESETPPFPVYQQHLLGLPQPTTSEQVKDLMLLSELARVRGWLANVDVNAAQKYAEFARRAREGCFLKHDLASNREFQKFYTSNMHEHLPTVNKEDLMDVPKSTISLDS